MYLFLSFRFISQSQISLSLFWCSLLNVPLIISLVVSDFLGDYYYHSYWGGDDDIYSHYPHF